MRDYDLGPARAEFRHDRVHSPRASSSSTAACCRQAPHLGRRCTAIQTDVASRFLRRGQKAQGDVVIARTASVHRPRSHFPGVPLRSRHSIAASPHGTSGRHRADVLGIWEATGVGFSTIRPRSLYWFCAGAPRPEPPNRLPVAGHAVCRFPAGADDVPQHASADIIRALFDFAPIRCWHRGRIVRSAMRPCHDAEPGPGGAPGIEDATSRQTTRAAARLSRVSGYERRKPSGLDRQHRLASQDVLRPRLVQKLPAGCSAPSGTSAA